MKLPDFLRSLADKRNAEGDDIWELLIQSAEYIEALESDKPASPKVGRVTEPAAPPSKISQVMREAYRR